MIYVKDQVRQRLWGNCFYVLVSRPETNSFIVDLKCPMLPLVKLAADLGTRLVMELGLTEFVHSDYLKVGLRRCWVLNGWIWFAQLGIWTSIKSNSSDVSFSSSSMLNVTSSNMSMLSCRRLLYVATIVRAFLAGCIQVGQSIRFRIYFAFLIFPFEDKVCKGKYPWNEKSTEVVNS